MSYSSAAEALLRRRYLEDIYERMTDEEKKIFVQMTMQNKNHLEIMQAIEQQRQQLDEIEKGQNWTRSFGSDLLANFTSAGVLWLGSKLLGKL
jgi:hypothetical protein